jgi:hypothetical protein
MRDGGLGAAVVFPLHAQVSLTSLVGGYVPASDLSQVSTSAQTVAKTRDGTLSLGLNLDLGPLRGSVAYASGTTIKDANRQAIGKGNVLATAADLVIRPMPRILVQPYLLAGAGEKFYKYDQSASLITGGDTAQFCLARRCGRRSDVRAHWGGSRADRLPEKGRR